MTTFRKTESLISLPFFYFESSKRFTLVLQDFPKRKLSFIVTMDRKTDEFTPFSNFQRLLSR